MKTNPVERIGIAAFMRYGFCRCFQMKNGKKNYLGGIATPISRKTKKKTIKK